jgi:hypothetical protein
MTRHPVVEHLQPKGSTGTPARYDALKGIGVAATAMTDSMRTWPHAGMLYRWKKEIRLFEMVSHKDLRDAVARPNFVWIEPTIPPERMRLVAAKARLVLERHKENAVPYGFGYRTTTFDEKGGLRLGSGEVGLTCSTIVAAILESERLRLIDPDTWPPPDSSDTASRKTFILALRQKDPEHAKVLHADIEAPRISPEEIVSAAAAYPAVSTFSSVQDGAAEVRRRIGTL